MKCTLLFTLILVPCVISKSILNGFLPNLPVGEYKMYARAIIKCKPMEGNIVDFNLYLYKTSVNTSEMRGNVTIYKPLDDSLNMHFNFAVKDSIGGWKDNAIVFQTSKACTQAKHLLGPVVSIVENKIGIIWSCPFPAGVYVVKGLDITNLVSMMNIPKQVFYGTYKDRIVFTDNKKKQVGCVNIILDVKRPWETE